MENKINRNYQIPVNEMLTQKFMIMHFGKTKYP